MELLAQVSLNAVMLSASYILLAVGMSLVFGVMRVVNVAHGSLYMVGAFALFIGVTTLGLNYWLALVMVIVVLFLLGIVIDQTTLRTTRGSVTVQFLITLGVMYVLDTGALISFGYLEKSVPPVVEGVTIIGGAVFANSRLLPTVLALLFVVALFLFLRYTKYGQAMRAVAQDRESACLLGVNTGLVFPLAFGIGAALAGIAGALMAPVSFIHPFLGQPILWKSFTIVIIGGLGSIPGCLVGGAVLGLLDSFMATYIGSVPAQLAAFGAVVVILLLRPSGLLGKEKL